MLFKINSLLWLRSFAQFFAYEVLNVFIKPAKRVTPSTILLIRLDAIGDYILFRNFIQALKVSNKYKNFKFTLVGNVAWRDLAILLDMNSIDEFIWLDRDLFKKDLFYRFRFLRSIGRQGYEVIISSVYSREYEVGDSIVRNVFAKQKIGSVGDLSNISAWKMRLSNRFYTKLVPATKGIVFEFYRNREFFEYLLGNLDFIKPEIDRCVLVPFRDPLPPKYVVVFIGASNKHRRWPVQYFSEVAKYLKCEHGLEVVLCGGEGDRENGELFGKTQGDGFINLVGKTTLSELLTVIEGATLLLSNDTGAVHFGVALEVPNILVVSNGNHLGRFVPYPSDLVDSYHAVFHPTIDRVGHLKKSMIEKYGFGSDLNIAEISVEMVIKRLDIVLK